MKNRFRLFLRRNGTYYCENCDTGQQLSLGTKDHADAVKLLAAKNNSYQNPSLNLALGKTYLAAHDPKLVSRTWAVAFDLWVSTGKKQSTFDRKAKAIKTAAFRHLAAKPITQTTSDELMEAIKLGGVSDLKYLRDVHNLALKSGWLAWPILAPKAWPKVKYGVKRAITLDEHQRIMAVEPMPEWQAYYRLLWEVGCSQSDGANLTAEAIDWTANTLAYQRGKSGSHAGMTIGPRLAAVLRTLVAPYACGDCDPCIGGRPDQCAIGIAVGCHLFPTLALMTEKSRAAHFQKRTTKAGVAGVTLHSYRYAWAERGAKAGYPERWAKAALGHKSGAVHEQYAKKAQVVCPSLEEYESKIVPLPKVG